MSATRRHPFRQVDVFTAQPLRGNPLAVVHDADDLDAAAMSTFANWTGLSETTFLLKPQDPRADYRLRIFTPAAELPFAGHPTLGSCHAWLEAGGRPQGPGIVQECGAGLIRIRRDAQAGRRLAFAAPPLLKSGPVEDAVLARIAASLRIEPAAIVAASHADNGPGWLAVMLRSRAEVLALDPDFAGMGKLKIGVVGPWDPARDGDECQFELRAFAPGFGVNEDPVTGSLNAAVAQWLIGAGMAPEAYIAGQGAARGRAGRVYVERVEEDIWVGGESITCVEGHVAL
jgi:PhzF family phenazine biosynthesis protein